MIPLTDKGIKFYKAQKVYHKKRFVQIKIMKSLKIKKKIRDHCHYTGKFRGAAHRVCKIRYKVPKKVSVLFHNGSAYDWNFITKHLPEKCEGQFEFLGENTEKYLTFLVPVEKEHDDGKTSTQKLKFIDCYRFMSCKLSDLVDTLSGIYNKELKTSVEEKKLGRNVNL